MVRVVKVRKFVTAITAVLCLVLAADIGNTRALKGVPIGAAPVTGNVVLGLAGVTYFGGFYPYLDITKAVGEINITNDATPGVTYSSQVPEGVVDIYGNQSTFGVGRYLDDNGDFLDTLPAGNISANRILWQITGGGPPNYVGQSVTVDWNGGDANWTVRITGTGGPFATGTGTTPLTFNWPSGADQMLLQVFGSGANPPKQIRVYKTANQSLINSGKILEPQYRDESALGGKYIRYMDWQSTNWNMIASSIADFPPLAGSGWSPSGNAGMSTVAGKGVTGVPIEVITGASIEMNKNPWIVIPEGFANPKIVQIKSISRSTTPLITTYGRHKFVNGDTVVFSNFGPYCGPLLLNPSSYSSSTFTVSGVNAIANDTPIVFGKLLNGTDDSSTYPTGITKGTVYWVVNATSTTFQIAATVAGSPIALTGSMTGTINVLENYGGGQTHFATWGQFTRITSYASSTFTLNNHGLPDGMPIQFGLNPVVPLNRGNTDSSTYPTGINKFWTYYVVNSTANTFQIAWSPGGAALTLTGSMTGPINMWRQLAFGRFTVANANQTAGTFEITGPGADTSGYNGNAIKQLGADAGTVFTPPDIAYTDAKVAEFVNYVRPRLTPAMEPIWEYGNEIWNPQFSAYHNDGSQVPISFTPNGVFGNTPVNSYMNGYLTALVAHSVRKAYGGHSGYKMIFGGNQSCCDQLGDTYGAVAGAQKYLADHGGGLTITDLFDRLSVTTYLGSVSYSGNGAPVAVTFGTNTIAFSGNVGPAGAAQTGFPIKLNTNSPGGTLPTGLTAGTLSNGTYPSGSGQIYWLVGSAPNFGLATLPNGTPLTFSGGSGSNTAATASEDVIQFLMAQSQAANISDPVTYPNEWDYISDKLAEDIADARWTGGIIQNNCPKCYTLAWQMGRYSYFKTNYTDPGKPLAGLPLIGYEGGESNVPVSSFSMLNDPTWRAMYSYQQYGRGSAANFLQMYQQAVQTGILTNQAQFVDVQALFIAYDYGDFGAQRYVGDNNPRWQGVKDVNSLNFLLKRDINPASNDNDPMFLEKAA